jgi:hypothetical protein
LNIIDNIEIKIAGDSDERATMMPLLYIDSKNKKEIEKEIKNVLDTYHKGEPQKILNP